MKRKSLVVLGSSGLVAVALTLCGTVGFNLVHADATGASPQATITVVGQSSQLVQPNEAIINAGVTTNGSDAQAAQKANDTVIQSLLTVLNQQGVKNEDVKTQWYNIHPNYGQPDKSGQPTMNGFQANDSLEIRVDDLTKVGTIVDLLVKSGANQINGVNYQISNTTDVQKQEYASALADARAQADSIAKSLGVHITGVFSADTTGSSSPGPIMYGTADKQSASTSLSPGTESVSTAVKVVYTIGNGN